MTRYLRERTLFEPLISEPPAGDLNLVVVIPAKDEPELIASLESLLACERPGRTVEVIVVVNNSEADSAESVERNAAIATEARGWAARKSDERLRFHVLRSQQLPRKHAGVGLARKIGLDEGCRRLDAVGNPRGVLDWFDADSRCDPNYLVEIERLFREDEACQACSIYFEHPIEGDEFADEIYEAIVGYELHLRYFVNAQRWAGFPHAVQTIGSSMAARCDAYQAQNGMNRRQAGEDFYFLHKFTPLGHVAELNSTRVIPSPRVSDRVPFGTGKAVGDLLETGETCLTYSPRGFEDLRRFFGSIDQLFEGGLPDWPESVTSFLSTVPFENRVAEIRSNVTTLEGFRTRFFRWFNAFLVMKFLHHARDRFYPNCEVEDAARWLLGTPDGDARTLLAAFRRRDRAADNFHGEKRNCA